MNRRRVSPLSTKRAYVRSDVQLPGPYPLIIVKPPSARFKQIREEEAEMDPLVLKSVLNDCCMWLQYPVSSGSGVNWAPYTSFIIHIIGRIADISTPNLPCKYLPIDQRLFLGVFDGFNEDLPIKNNAVEIGNIFDRFIHQPKKKVKPVRALPEAIKYVITNYQKLPIGYSPEYLYAIFGEESVQAHNLLCRISQILLDEMFAMTS